MRKFLSLSLICVACSISLARAKDVPPQKELASLTSDSILSFNQAIQAKDFTAFHKQISALWQAQVTPSKLKEIFQSFIDQQIDLSIVKGVEPVFSEPAKINEDGVLVLKGTFPTTPTKVDFQLKYLNEKSAWKLVGINVNASPSGPAGQLPSEDEAKTLARSSLSSFNAAVQTKSFVDFHKEIALLWQKQVTPAKLSELFAPFVEQGIDIGGVATKDPTFDPAPRINDNGLLELKGTYALPPNNLLFDLAYIFEAPEWKLVKINVKIRPSDASKSEKPESATKKQAGRSTMQLRPADRPGLAHRK